MNVIMIGHAVETRKTRFDLVGGSPILGFGCGLSGIPRCQCRHEPERVRAYGIHCAYSLFY
jgi:hypothetical protein